MSNYPSPVRTMVFALLALGSLSGCGRVASTPPAATHTAAAAPRLPAPPPALILEPGAGLAPWAAEIGQARTGIDVNAYLIDNAAILKALRQAGARGVPIHILLAPNPYEDIAAVPEERRALAAIPDSTVRNAPLRFDQAYAFDHAKYLVVNPGTARVAVILGSPNFTDSAFDGTNLEAAVTVGGAPARAAAQVFQADWTDQPAGPGPRQALVLSPGAAPAWLRLLHSPGPIQMMAEEIGDDPTILAQMAADGTRFQLLCPPPSSSDAQARLNALAQAGVQIRTLSTPDVHAKVLITARTAFLGSQNLSAVSLNDNREVGLLVTGANRTTLATWFQRWWQTATPWRDGPSPRRVQAPPNASSSRRPWIPSGASMATVRHLWGSPSRIYPTTYHGHAQIAWVYPAATVYFVAQRMVAVADR